ncbi:MAG: heavy-metal-associated domain-containing protein [Muribaculaceae bacterium]|nr:heavy-metal-associated domain-containing protein [Muribaculaceae bacterium]
MKKLLICMFMVFGSMTIYAKDIKEYVVTTNPQMSCQNCENKIKGNLRFEKGVKKVETNLKEQTVTVTYDADKTDEAKLAEAFGKLNYQVQKVGDKNATKKQCSKSSCDGESKSCCKNKKN